MTNGNLVLVGCVTGAFGIKGDVKVQSYTQNPFDITAYGKLHTKSGQLLNIKILRIVKGSTLIARIENCATRNESESYKGTELYVLRSAMPEPLEDEYYLADLEGLKVVCEKDNNTILGTVQAVYNFGAGDFLEIILTTGKVATLPFNKEAVIQVDKFKQIIINESFLIY